MVYYLDKAKRKFSGFMDGGFEILDNIRYGLYMLRAWSSFLFGLVVFLLIRSEVSNTGPFFYYACGFLGISLVVSLLDQFGFYNRMVNFIKNVFRILMICSVIVICYLTLLRMKTLFENRLSLYNIIMSEIGQGKWYSKIFTVLKYVSIPLGAAYSIYGVVHRFISKPKYRYLNSYVDRRGNIELRAMPYKNVDSKNEIFPHITNLIIGLVYNRYIPNIVDCFANILHAFVDDQGNKILTNLVPTLFSVALIIFILIKNLNEICNKSIIPVV